MKEKLQNIKTMPYISIGLICINTLIFLVSTMINKDFYYWGGVGYYVLLETKEYYRVITAMFLHQDVSHLFGNMLMLFAIGDMIEIKLGRIKYLSFYIVSGIGGTILSILVEMVQSKVVYSIGASGAVYGLLGILCGIALLKNIPNVQMSFQKIVVVLSIMIIMGFKDMSVNNMAHIGGLFIGFSVYLLSSLIIKISSKGRRDK